MKVIKNNILGFIIGAIIFTGLGVYAGSTYSASQVTYKNTTVDKALNDLYSNKINRFGTASYATSQGDAATTRSKSISLNKGKYLIIVSHGVNWRNPDSGESRSQAVNHDINCTSNSCEITPLSGYLNHIKPSLIESGSYNYVRNYTYSYYVKIAADNDTISVTDNLGWSHATVGQYVTIHAIPINN